MGRLYESLQRPLDRPMTPRAEAPLNVVSVNLPLLASQTPTLPDWQPWIDEATVPFVEVPEPGASRTDSEEVPPRVVPFRPPESLPANQPVRWESVPTPSIHESYRQVAGQVLEELRDRSLKSLLLLPVGEARPMAEVATELSMALSSLLRQQVILVDTLRSPDSATDRLGVNPAPGWEEYLLTGDVASVVQRSRVGGLQVVAAGNRLASVSSTNWTKDAGRRLQALQQMGRLLIVTCPPWPDSPLGLLLAAETSGTCLVVPPSAVDSALQQQVLHLLQADGQNVLGAIVAN